MLFMITYFYYVSTVVQIRLVKKIRAFLDMFLYFQIFDRFVNIVQNFSLDDAQNVRERLN